MKPPLKDLSTPRSAILCVGSELLRGKVSTHGATVARRLASVGLTLDSEQILGDEQVSVAAAIVRCLRDFEITIVTGGLGPTFDDVSREAAAQATGRALELSQALLRELRAKFRRARYPMPPANRRQALLIHGALPVENIVGTAPGQWLEIDGRILVLLPGPPSELHPMLDKFVLPKLRRHFKTTPITEAHLHFVGVAESVVDQRLRPLMARAEQKMPGKLRCTILAHLGLVDFDIFISHPKPEQAQRALKQLVSAIQRRMGPAFYGMDTQYPLEKIVGDLFRQKCMTLATAESCTGGLLSAALTSLPGSSDFYVGGVVSYSNNVKASVLGVSVDLLRSHGAVSEAVGRSMAERARERTGSTWAVSITGIAGPGGGTAQKPVGLVYIALAGPRATQVTCFRFKGSREVIRQRSVTAALDLLRRLR